MITKRNTNWNLLAKKLAGETGADEEAGLEVWLGKSAANSALFEEIKSDWKKMEKMDKQFNVDRAWGKLNSRIMEQEGKAGTGAVMYQRTWMTPVRLAASFLLIAILGASAVWTTYKLRTVTVSTASNDRVRGVDLPDGSVVYLNADSKITYSRDFNRKNRTVSLAGEAFFEVAPDKSHPFVIHADKADIRVVGTSFNVRATAADHNVEVYVATGVVELFPAGQAEGLITLRPGDIGLVAEQKVSSRKSRNANPIAWKTGEMDFRDTRLSDAIAVLNGLYKVNIVCNEPGLDTTLTNGTYRYPDESLEQILTILCTQNNMKARNENNTIYLSR